MQRSEMATCTYCLMTWLLLVGICQVMPHPQCLDFTPPFKSESDLQMCTEYRDLGCCNAAKDSEINETYNAIIKNMTQEENETCGEKLKALLCQVCSPYAAHVYDAEDGPTATSFPGLCKGYCDELLMNCSSLIPLVTSDKRLVRLSETDQNKFCQAVSAPDNDYCYPDLKTNPVLSTSIGTIQYYQKRTGMQGKYCVRMCVQEFANRLRNPVAAKHSKDGTHRLFVVEQIGMVWVYLPNGTRLLPPFLDLRELVLVREYGYDERGMLDIEFHPNYTENGLFYLYYTVLINYQHHIKISEMKVSADNMNLANVGSERTILVVQEPAFNHNGGQLLFGDDGYLYIFTGDGGYGGDPFGAYGNGQNKKVFHGKVLRIDINSKGKTRPYAIPADNPFVNNSRYLPEIWALGVRNMWRCSKDRGSPTGEGKGRIFCGDVGQSRFEEIDLIEKGANYGWRAYEGNSCYDRNMCNKKFVENHARPIHAYSHNVGKSVTGGYVYRGCRNPNLHGKYIFGDYANGKLFLLAETPKGKWKRQNVCMGEDYVCKNGGLLNDYGRHILAFGEDESGEVYMLSTTRAIPGMQGGRIYKLVDPARTGDPSVCAGGEPRETILKPGTAKIPYEPEAY